MKRTRAGARACAGRACLFLSLGNPMELLELQTKTGAGPNRTTWDFFFTSGSAAQMKMDEKSAWLLMVPLPHLNFFHFRSFSRGPFGTGSIQAICRDYPVALRGGAQIC